MPQSPGPADPYWADLMGRVDGRGYGDIADDATPQGAGDRPPPPPPPVSPPHAAPLREQPVGGGYAYGSASRPRIAWRVFGVFLLLLTLGSTSFLAYSNYRATILWAAAHDEVKSDLRKEQQAHQAALEELDAAQRDVSSLEARIDDLANEKAQAEDTRNMMTITAASWQVLSERLAENAEATDGCVDLMQKLYNFSVEVYNGALLGVYADADRWNYLADGVWDYCGDVQAESWDLRQFVAGFR